MAVRFHCILGRLGESSSNGTQPVVGYYSTWGDQPYGRLIILELAVIEGTSLYNVLWMLFRHLKAELETDIAQFCESPPTHFLLSLGETHPACTALQSQLRPANPFTWYVRVSELTPFLQHIAPVLERRLRQSVMSGFNGNLWLSFYRNGLQLNFIQGQLARIVPWNLADAENEGENQARAAFPPLVFLQLLFGYRSLKELRYAFPDCWANQEGRCLLNILFPKEES